ncbi:MAG: helix-turn-helix domain-containing protein [Clostridia bacterium]|nr:helix-turn-helix domain-containing protein [Clostridia bacterium]
MFKSTDILQYITHPEPISAAGTSAVYFEEKDCTLPSIGEIRQLHYHARLELGVCTKGTGLFIIDRPEITVESLTAGDVLLIGPNVRHYSRSIDGECACRFCYIDLPAVAHKFLNNPQEQLRRLAIPPVLRADDPDPSRREAHALLFRLLEGLKKSSSRPVDEDLTCLRLSELLLCCEDWFGEAAPSADHADAALSAAVSHLSLHYAENITAAELAARCYISESQLRRRFNDVYGMPPFEYLHRLRCQIGAQLLERTQLSAADIARRVGYDSGDFYRHFRRIYGVAPTVWRRLNTRYDR